MHLGVGCKGSAISGLEQRLGTRPLLKDCETVDSIKAIAGSPLRNSRRSTAFSTTCDAPRQLAVGDGPSGRGQVVVVLNWFAEVQRRLGNN